MGEGSAWQLPRATFTWPPVPDRMFVLGNSLLNFAERTFKNLARDEIESFLLQAFRSFGAFLKSFTDL